MYCPVLCRRHVNKPRPSYVNKLVLFQCFFLGENICSKINCVLGIFGSSDISRWNVTPIFNCQSV